VPVTPFKPIRDTGRRNVIFFGDSISYGAFVSPHRVWVTQLAAMIEREFGEAFLVINAAVSGNTTRLALERMPDHVQRYGCEILCVQFGLNDGNQNDPEQGLPRVSLDAYRANLKEIIARGYHVGAKAILLPTSHPTLRRATFPFADRSYEDARHDYVAVIREIAAVDNRVHLVDIEKIFEAHLAAGRKLEEFLLKDQVHLSHAGHDLYVEAFAPILTRLLRGN
jgi:lysophospholipase L1-like esterase